ncbi:MAG: hypothetical protein HY721_31355 [Planctomycetes bacterium]|nr:hypothetical protein [Planctomycetota bacterium]
MGTVRSRLACLAFLAAALGALPRRVLVAEPGDLLGYVPFATVAPQDIALDEDGTCWITALLENRIYHYERNLAREIERFDYPRASSYPTGIAYNSVDGSILAADATGGQILELVKDAVSGGLAVRREILPEFERPPNGTIQPYPRGMAFDPLGDGGNGSLYVVESTTTLIYELRLDGSKIRAFPHPDDPDGYPGKGQTAHASDIDIIYDAGRTRLLGFYVTGGATRISSIRRLDPDGKYEGVAVPLADAGGNVSGILRAPFEWPPGSGRIADAFLCVVESNARFALLEGGEPEFREVVGFSCTVSGREVRLDWSVFGPYDGIEVRRGCEVLETLPGNATTWRRVFDEDGVYVLTLRAFRGTRAFSPAPCTAVIGMGRVTRVGDVEGELPVDLAEDGAGTLLVSDSMARKIRLFDLDLRPTDVLSIPETVGDSRDIITGIAFAEASSRIYLFDASTSRVAILDDTGAHLATFDAKLPNLETDPGEDPDLGTVIGMDHDPSGDGGRGSLWVVEAERDWIYEIDLEGNVITEYPHPYLAIEPPPPETPFGISTSGIALVEGSPDQLYLTGGSLRDLRQVHILRVEKRTGSVIPGSVISTAGIRAAASDAALTLESFLGPGGPRLVALTIAGKSSKLVEVDLGPPPGPAPTFLKAVQPRYADDVVLTWQRNADHDALEVFRDCALVATLPGNADGHVDRGVAPGFHEYAVRAVLRGAHSDFARASLQVGPGAVLERSFLWPARSPQQLTQDPVDGTYAVSVNWPGDERKVFHYDRDLRFLRVRDSVVSPDWEIASLAIRGAGAQRTINYIIWQLPVPIGDVDQQRFFLVKEGLGGEPMGEREIFPPRPTNGFVTFPTGLAWDPKGDTFYFLERNSKTFVQMDPEGNLLRTFPHPAPPFQNFVFNLGLDVVPERGTIFITGSDRYDHKVTKVLEMTPVGVLTGLEIPIGRLPATVTGITLRGDDLVAVATGSFSEIFRLKAFREQTVRFVRGDSDGNGSVNLSDVVVTLRRLFQGGAAPSCPDAADADDSGSLNLTDAVVTLGTLFLGRGPLPEPYPDLGGDPTPDGLPCF